VEVFVDNLQIDYGFVGDLTLEAALRDVQSNVCAPGRLVVTVRCNGQDVPANEMSATLQKSASTFDRLEVFTSTPEGLVTEAMSQASAALQGTEDACRRIAELLTEGNAADAMQDLGECLGVWQKIHEAVRQSIHILEVDPESAMIEGEALTVLIARPKEVLLRVKQALESQDHVLLADVLQYEFEEVTRQWHNIIGMLLGRAEALAEQT